MNLKDIAQQTAVIHQREITLKDNEGNDVITTAYMRKLPFNLVWGGESLTDEDGNKLNDEQIIARRIAYTFVDKAGKPLFTESQVYGIGENALRADIVFALMTAMGELNDLGKIFGIPSSPMKTNSGASSLSTESVGTQSKKPRVQ